MATKKTTTRITLSPDQQAVYDEMYAWAQDPHGVLSVGGLAGTGKTTLLAELAVALAADQRLVAYVCFTGRAAGVLGRKLKAAGVEVTDGLMPTEEMREREERGIHLKGAAARLYDFDLTGDPGDPALVGTTHRLLYAPIINAREELSGWSKREVLDREYGFVVIDEASMIGDKMLADLQVHGKPILAVGDHGQLPPVQDTGSLMKNPHLKLERIHRQAEGNPIIALAHTVRTEGRLASTKHADGKHIVVRPKRDLEKVLAEAYAEADDIMNVGVLCWTNKARIALNASARKVLGKRGVPQEGELVLALRNAPPVFNGMRGVLTEDARIDRDDEYLVHMSVNFPEEEVRIGYVTACAPVFTREKPFATVEELATAGIHVNKMSQAGQPYTFGYAMTVHKSQGSQFDHAIVWLDRPEFPRDEDWRRWAYTAITRAAKKLTILTG